jgi:hypothetical protein
VTSTRRKLGFCLLSLAIGGGLTGTTITVFGRLETPATRTWLVERIKPNQASLWGRYTSSYLGGSLAVGDVNGDGFDDLITNGRSEYGNMEAGGEIYVIPGPLAFNEAYTMPQHAALVFEGLQKDIPTSNIYLESGDVNGDGIDDIVMASWSSNSAHVYLGSSSIQSNSPVSIAVLPENMALNVTQAEGGIALCDFNADGRKDVFVQHDSSEGGVEVWGLLGSSTFTMTAPITRVLPSEAQIVFNGFQHEAHFSLPSPKNMTCGDIDGDGYPDLAIGIYGESPTARDGAGIVYIIRGDPEITSNNPVTLTMPGQAGAIIEGEDGRDGAVGDSLGMGLASADVNLDGRADLILGAPHAWGPENLISHAGEVYLWLGRALAGQRFIVSSQASWIVHGEEESDLLGTAIATGDFDNDGYPEILLGCGACARQGAPSYQSGRGYVLEPLQITGQVSVSTVSQFDIVPYRDARCLPEAVSAMDFNGDGVSDLVLSAPCTDYTQGNLRGAVYIISYPDHFRSRLPIIHK